MTTPKEAYEAAEKRLLQKGGKLRFTTANVNLITGHIIQNSLQPTEENFYQAFKDCLRELDWEKKPPQLVAIEANERPATIQSAAKSENEFGAKVRAGEKADADVKEYAALVKQCRGLIDSYNPTRNTARGPAYDARERIDSQNKWNASFNEAMKRDVGYMRQYTKTLAATIAKRYADREKAAEHI